LPLALILTPILALVLALTLALAIDLLPLALILGTHPWSLLPNFVTIHQGLAQFQGFFLSQYVNVVNVGYALA
jgi:hypothetical protein